MPIHPFYSFNLNRYHSDRGDEAPHIWIPEEAPLLPLAQVRQMKAGSFPNKDEPGTSEIRIWWDVDAGEKRAICFETNCRLNDNRLVAQAKDSLEAKEVIQKVADAIASYLLGRGECFWEIMLNPERHIHLDNVPEVFLPYCRQIIRWRELVYKVRNPRYEVRLDDDKLVLGLCPYNIMPTVSPAKAENWDDFTTGGLSANDFAFDPGDRQPIVDVKEKRAYWEVGEPDNVIYTLPFGTCDERTAKRFSFFTIWHSFDQARKAEEERVRESSTRYQQEKSRNQVKAVDSIMSQLGLSKD